MSIFLYPSPWTRLAGMLRASCFLLLFLIIPCNIPAATGTAAHGSPLRPFYPTVKTIDTEHFLKIYFDAIIIDVRSRFEFDVIHINKAKHVSLTKGDFIDTIKRYRALVSETPLILYCNDSASASAFRAALLVQSTGYQNVFVYDAGVFPLLTLAPEKITLMATTPAQPDLIIPSNYYEKVRIDFEEFRKRSLRIGTLIIDIRDVYENTQVPRIGGIRHIPMESFLKAVSNRIWAEKKLLIFDRTGEKTQLLQYFLQANGYFDYAFLRGGMEGLDKNTQLRAIHRSGSEVSLNQHSLLQLTLNNRMSPLDSKIINLLLSSITLENHALIRREQLPQLLGCTPEQLKTSAIRLREARLLLFGETRDSFVFHMDPQLVWKGEMSGELWKNRVKEFTASTAK